MRCIKNKNLPRFTRVFPKCCCICSILICSFIQHVASGRQTQQLRRYLPVEYCAYCYTAVHHVMSCGISCHEAPPTSNHSQTAVVLYCCCCSSLPCSRTFRLWVGMGAVSRVCRTLHPPLFFRIIRSIICIYKCSIFDTYCIWQGQEVFNHRVTAVVMDFFFCYFL